MNGYLAFIILTWNSEKFIYDCLESINNIEIESKAIIVIDKGSKDNTVNIIRKFKDICLIELDKNYGTTFSRNIGLKMASKYSYICIIDSDTIINNNAIENLIICLNEGTDHYIAVPRMVNIYHEHQLSYKKFPTVISKLLKAAPISILQIKGIELEEYHFTFKSDYYYVDYGISACWMLKGSILNKIGYLDEKIFYAPEDVDYCAMVWEKGGKVVLVSNSEIIHATQRISKKKVFSKINLLHILGLIYYFQKHKYIFSTKHIRSQIK